MDRIGGGDGFVGGMLYAVLRGWEPEKWVQFGWASGALVTTLLTDSAKKILEQGHSVGQCQTESILFMPHNLGGVFPAFRELRVSRTH